MRNLLVLFIVNIHSMQLQSYLDTYVGFIVEGPISNAITSDDVTGTGVHYSQTGPIYVGPHAEAPNVLYVSQNIGDLVSDNSSPSNYLPVKANKACFLSLRQPFGHWFFTPFLSGCEVWIATRNGQEPIMFHVNTVDCQYTTEDLTERENMAIEALDYIGSTYTFVYRLMSPRPTIAAISEYLTEFHNRHLNIRVGAYALGEGEGGIFYGQYPAQPASDNTVVYAGWSFRCKNSGNVNLFNIGKSIVYIFQKYISFHYAILGMVLYFATRTITETALTTPYVGILQCNIMTSLLLYS